MNELGNFKAFCKNFLGYSFFKYNRRVNFYIRFTEKHGINFNGVLLYSDSVTYVKNSKFSLSLYNNNITIYNE